MTDATQQIRYVTSFQDLVATPFTGVVNAACWERKLTGNFSEITDLLPLTGNITEVTPEALQALPLSEQGQLARNTILQDWQLLETYGASPVLNIISHYERDHNLPFFPTDVYSFHADRAPVPADTFLCTYYGACSELLPDAQARKKTDNPEIRARLREMYDGPEEGFTTFLTEYFFDLHYEALPGASPVSLGTGNLWRLAVDHPGSKVHPCVHRAPEENPGQKRLLLIC